MRTDSRTSATLRATIRKLAAESFRDHVLEDLGTAGDTRVFNCGPRQGSAFRFRVVLWPGWVVVADWVGDTMFQHGENNSLAWLRSVVGHTRYMLLMVRGARKVFMIGDAEKFLSELAKPEPYDTVWRGWQPDGDSPETFYRACHDAGIEEPPDCTDYESDHLWAVEALRWFVAALDAKELEAVQ